MACRARSAGPSRRCGCPAPAAEAADIAGSDAVQLFIARASERLPDFHAADVAPHSIAELCRRLDGLPLAIELIAGWVGTLSIREMLQQRAVLLDSEPAQHGGRRLADVMQASYDLLTAEQQGRLAMLSVFAGPFRIADVQAILDVDLATAVATARALVDSSWLVVTRGGEQNVFSMLETIATFAALQLARSLAAPPSAAGTRCTSPPSPPRARRRWPAPTRPIGPRGWRRPSPTWIWRCTGRASTATSTSA